MIESGSAKLLRLLREPVVTEIPKGWKTTKQLCAETGMSSPMILKLLRDAKVPVRKFKIPVSDGILKPVPHYFIKRAT